MSVKIAINGFGRIGRLALRQIFGMPGFEIVGINDLTNPEMLVHLLKYDSTQGTYGLSSEVSLEDKSLVLGGKKIKTFASKNPADLPWKSLGVDVVLECTGFFNSKDKASAHLEAGAKKVLLSAPAGKDVPTVVYGINEKSLKASDLIVSAASCTTNCLAPLAYNLNKLAPIKKGFMTTAHAYTGDQMVLDGAHPKGNLRRARTAAENIIPTSTGAAKAIGMVLPELDGKLDGVALRVPVPVGSIVELVAVCEKKIKAEEINRAMKEVENSSFSYTEDPIVSTDIIGSPYGGIFDSSLTRCSDLGDKETLVSVSAWYDNENGYTAQLVRLLKYMAKL